MPKLNVQQNNANVIKALRNALAIGQIKGPIASDGADNFSSAGSNRNLLDNPWFTVNQRSAGSTSDGYPADRWLKVGNTAATATATANGLVIALNGSAYCDLRNRYSEAEIITPNLGKTATISIMLADGTVFSDQIVLSTTQQNRYLNSEKIRFNLNVSGGVYLVRLVLYDDMTIRAVKLELGSVSTLANDAPPDYGTELAKCQRSFVRFEGLYANVGFGLAASTTLGYILIPTPVFMRKAPNIVTISYSEMYLFANSGYAHAINSITVQNGGYSFNAAGVTVSVNSSGLVAGEPLLLQPRASGGYLDISADL